MPLHTALPQLITWVVALTDPVPEDKDVKAGWTAFVIFIALIIAVALLGWSLVRQLRKAQAAKEAGVYGSDGEGDGDGAGRADRPGGTDLPSGPVDGADDEKPADHQS